jgi:hypothetical protein
MNNKTGRPDHIEDYLITVRNKQWFGWSDSKNKVYTNLIVHDGGSKPSESDCTAGLKALQDNFDTAKTNAATKKASGKQKLKDLGLDDDEIKALTGA